MKSRIKLNGLILLLATLTVILFPRIIIRNADYAFDDFLEAFGVSLILTGQLLRVSARGYKAEQSRKSTSLVVTGPYAMVRNPMYLGIIMIGCGLVLAVLKPWALLIFLAGFLFLYHNLFPKEEKSLAQKFGNSYKEYCSAVPRILPRASFIIQNDISSYLPVRLSWLKREMLSIILILAVVLVIESWEELNLRGWSYVPRALAPQMAVLCLYLILTVLLARKYEKVTQNCKNNK
ncbi:MAG: isoprenylcysteine carboxylmethyltransferase family protein [Candidatus Omnitrophica bacterium]|nr:isoprenylcysteine carboxylmethyltransferase family protein [Candidatus Omnitrophota bacterium]